MVFAIALLVTGLLVASVDSAIRLQDRSEFENEVSRTLDSIRQHIGTTATLVRGTVGLFDASTEVTPQEFGYYVRNLDLRGRYPGILGIGFTRRIPAGGLAEFEQAMRERGFPDFRVWPAGPRSEYHSIELLEPLDVQNRRAIGYDMSTQPVRRAAMLDAARRGDVVASGKVTLVQEARSRAQAGFLMYMPVFASSRSAQGDKPVRGPLLGYVYSPLRVGDWLRGTRGAGAGLIDFEIFDGETADPEALLHSTLDEATDLRTRFSANHLVDVAGRHWLVRFYSRPEQIAHSQTWLVPWLALAALGTSLLLSRLSWAQLRARRDAEAAATSQRESARALQKEREWLRAILASIGDGVVAVDAQGRVVLMNPVAERLTGWEHAQADGRRLDEVVRASEPADEGISRGALPGGEGSGEILLHDREGRLRPVDHSSAPIRNQSGVAEGAVIVMRDASERHRVEAELRDNDRRKDEFLAMLAHELRNPLAPICNALETLRRDPDPEQSRRALAMAERQARLMVRLVNDLLDLSRISRGAIKLQRKPVALATVLDTALESSRLLIDSRRHQLHVDAIPDDLCIDGDHARLAQVFTNLLNNAATYTDPGGRIDVTVRRDGDDVEVSVRDNGVGIEAESLPHVFDMFVQAERSLERSGGLGIGLTLVRQLVQMHGGSVQARSAGIGAGSEFVVHLPLTPGHAGTAQPAGPAIQPAGQPLRLLVVDDNHDTADSLAMVLRLAGHQVETCYDGAAALEIARETAPDVVLLDIGLPGMNGYEVASRLRSLRGDSISLVAITGWGQQEDRRRALEAGFNFHLVKPIEYAELEAMLRSLR